MRHPHHRRDGKVLRLRLERDQLRQQAEDALGLLGAFVWNAIMGAVIGQLGKTSAKQARVLEGENARILAGQIAEDFEVLELVPDQDLPEKLIDAESRSRQDLILRTRLHPR